MPNKNEPLLLRPSGKDYLWGGSRLNDEFEKSIDMTPTSRNVGMFHAPRWTQLCGGRCIRWAGAGRGAENASGVSG